MRYYPWVSRSFQSLQEEIQHFKGNDLYHSVWLKPHDSCLLSALPPHLGSPSHCLLCKGERKSSRIFPFIMRSSYSFPGVAVPLLPQTPFFLPSDTEHPYITEPATAHLPALPRGTAAKHTRHQAAHCGLPETHILSSLYSQKQNIVWFWIMGMKANLYKC